jgi:hypothetical protein
VDPGLRAVLNIVRRGLDFDPKLLESPDHLRADML